MYYLNIAHDLAKKKKAIWETCSISVSVMPCLRTLNFVTKLSIALGMHRKSP